MTLEEIIDCVNVVSKQDITLKTRKRNIIILRSIYYKIARDNTTESLGNIGLKVGKKTHATVLNGLKTITHDLRDEKWWNIYSYCLKLLNTKESQRIKIDNKTYLVKYIEKEVIKEVKSTNIPEYIINHLEQYNEKELRDLYESRLKPYYRMMSKIKSKLSFVD